MRKLLLLLFTCNAFAATPTLFIRPFGASAIDPNIAWSVKIRVEPTNTADLTGLAFPVQWTLTHTLDALRGKEYVVQGNSTLTSGDAWTTIYLTPTVFVNPNFGQTPTVTFSLIDTADYDLGSPTTVTIPIITIDTDDEPPPPDPNPVVLNSIVNNGNNTYTLSWNSVGLPGFTYGIYRDTQATAPFNTLLTTTSGLTFVDTLNADGTYYYYIAPIRGGIEGDRSNVQSVVVVIPKAPNPPLALTVSDINTTGATLRWTDNSSDETGFRVYNGAAQVGSSLAENATSVILTGLTPSTAYTLHVKSFNSVGESAASNTVTFSTPSDVTISPMTLNSLVENTPTSFQVNWTDNSTGEQWQELQASTDSFINDIRRVDRFIAANVVTYNVTGPLQGGGAILEGATYYIRGRVRDAAGNQSAFSNVLSITLSAPTVGIPGQPTVSTINTNQVNVSWSSAVNATSYTLERGTNGTTFPTVTAGLTSPFAAVTGLTADTLYYFRVNATDGATTSAYSAIGSGRTLGNPPPQDDLTISASVTGRSFDLNVNNGGDPYVVEISWSLDVPAWMSITNSSAAAINVADSGFRTVPPAYVSPGDPYMQTYEDDTVGGHHVIINPSNGPGTVELANYTTAVGDLSDNQIVYMYVSTRWGTRPIAEVRLDIDRAFSFYTDNGLKGIFLDETPTNLYKSGQTSITSYYESLYAYITQHANAPAGVEIIVNCPGYPFSAQDERYLPVAFVQP